MVIYPSMAMDFNSKDDCLILIDLTELSQTELGKRNHLK